MLTTFAALENLSPAGTSHTTELTFLRKQQRSVGSMRKTELKQTQSYWIYPCGTPKTELNSHSSMSSCDHSLRLDNSVSMWYSEDGNTAWAMLPCGLGRVWHHCTGHRNAAEVDAPLCLCSTWWRLYTWSVGGNTWKVLELRLCISHRTALHWWLAARSFTECQIRHWGRNNEGLDRKCVRELHRGFCVSLEAQPHFEETWFEYGELNN